MRYASCFVWLILAPYSYLYAPQDRTDPDSLPSSYLVSKGCDTSLPSSTQAWSPPVPPRSSAAKASPPLSAPPPSPYREGSPSEATDPCDQEVENILSKAIAQLDVRAPRHASHTFTPSAKAVSSCPKDHKPKESLAEASTQNNPVPQRPVKKAHRRQHSLAPPMDP